MGAHFNDSHNQKRTYDNYASALLQCNKYNSRNENLGQRKHTPYKCKICEKFHVGGHNKLKVTFKVQEEAKEKIAKSICNTLLVTNVKIPK